MAGLNRQILLKSRPVGAPSLGNFELTERPTSEPGEGGGAHAHSLSLA